ncbi:phosphopantetheine-binding protein [Embleya sp. NPDC050493]|uniref:phosphopantetheine-binding protein n=1 Tax=Embleya sp. NPDC050493 TaxID=3363989 RepID=UPI0037B9805B
MTEPGRLSVQARRRALRSVLRRIDHEARDREFTEPRPEGAEVPLTLDQEWLYTAASAVPDLARMAVGGRLETGHRLDHERLRAAVESVAAATPALGLLVGERGGALVQTPGRGARVDWHDSPDEPAWTEPFDPRHGPLCRAAITAGEGNRAGGPDTVLSLAVARHALDRTSVGLLLAAVARAYEDGTAPPVGGFDVADHAYWHRRRFGPERLADLLPRAADRLGPARPSLLPYDRPPVAGPPSAAGAALRRPAPAPVDPPVALVAAVGAALRRFGASSPLRLGLDDPGRHTPQTEHLVGRLGTAGVLALRIDGGVDAASLTDRAREAVAASGSDPLPIAALADLQPPTWGAEPLLPVGLEAVSLPAPRVAGGPARIRLLPSPVPMYDLELVLTGDPSGAAELLAEYDPDLFDRSTVDALTALVAHFLDSAASTDREQAPGAGTQPAAGVASSPRAGALPPPPARAGASPATAPHADATPATPRDGDFGSVDALAGWAARSPDDVVISAPRGTMTAACAAAAVRTMREALAEAGVRVGDAVVLRADDSAAGAVALPAALGFGADVLVRCAADPPAWSERVAHAAHARFELFPDGTITPIPTADDQPRTASTRPPGDAPGALLVGLRAYPSPRVVRLPSPTLLRAAARHADASGLSASDVFAPDFEWGGEEAAICVLAAACSGAALLLPTGGTADARFDALAEAGATVAELPYTFAESVPVHLLDLRASYRRLTEPAAPGEQDAGAPRGRWWAAAAPDAVLTGPDPRGSTCPAPHHVLNDDLMAVPVGGTGTLWAPVEPGAGYLGEPAACAADFRPDPAGTGGRVVNTGALVRVGADGTLRLVRLPEDRVCARGRSILVEDLAAALTRRTGRPAAAGVQPLDWGRAERPYAAIRAPAGPDPTPEGLVDLLRRDLPAVAVPERVLVVEADDSDDAHDAAAAMPAGADLDHAARAAAERNARFDSRPYTPPETDTERALVRDVLVPVLGVPRVGRDDNFFGLGGTSLQLIQVLARVHATHGVDVAPADVFAAPTLRRLAESIDRVRTVASRDLHTIDELLTTVEDTPDDAPEPATRVPSEHAPDGIAKADPNDPNRLS